LAYLALPPHTAFSNADIRVDGGVRMGDTISPFYDPMIAKLIVWGADRDQARARMVQALAQTQVVGVHTNVAFLTRLMTDQAFAACDLDTGLIEQQRATLLPAPAPASHEALAFAVAALLLCETAAVSDDDPWARTDGWRLNGLYRRAFSWVDQEGARSCVLHRQGIDQVLEMDGERYAFGWRTAKSGNAVKNHNTGKSHNTGKDDNTAKDDNTPALNIELTLGHLAVTGTVVRRGERFDVFSSGAMTSLVLKDPLKHAADGQSEPAGGLTAPMPGKVIAVHVAVGDKVKRGQALLVMEAMKMEHTIAAPGEGTVKELLYGVGDQVAEGAALITLG
jgi:3-methylcrotonyl-CoA carboxylase alpha subunit